MNNAGFKRGLFYGVTAVGIYLVTYLVNKRFLFSPGFSPITGIVLPIVFMVLAARDTRTAQEGVMTFAEALSATFLTYVIGSLIFSIFSYIMTALVDPSLLKIAQEVAIEAMDKLSGFLDEDQVDIMKDAVEEGTEGTSIGATLMGWAFSLILPGFIFAAIISAIMKRNAVA